MKNTIFELLPAKFIGKELKSKFLVGESSKPAPKSTPISQISTVINDIPPEGILINKPGEYEFARDVVWKPTDPYVAAIHIMSDNITIDFKGFSLTANISDNGQQLFGILINRACEIIGNDKATFPEAKMMQNITVQNGVIKGITYRGVSAEASAGVTNFHIINMTIEGIVYKETTIPNVTPCGIFIELCNTFKVENCMVQYMEVTTPSCAGIQIISSVQGTVEGCILKNFVNHDGGVQGYSYIACSTIYTKNCIVQNLQSHYQGNTDTTGHTAIGYIPIFCSKLTFNDCSATDVTGCCDDAHGMSVFLDSCVTVNRFKAKNITYGICSGNTGAKATGLEVYGVDIEINDSIAENIKAIVPQDLQAAGFSAWGYDIRFNNCRATGVLVTDAARNPSAKYGYGTGFGWAPDPRSEFNAQPANMVLYNNCRAYNCQLGFDTWSHTNSQWKEVMSYSCPIFILSQPGTTRTLSMDKCSESPDGKPREITLVNMAQNNDYPEVETPKK